MTITMDDSGTLERARSILEKHKQWMENHDRSSIVRDAEKFETAYQESSESLALAMAERLPQAAASPSLPHRPSLGPAQRGKAQRIDPRQEEDDQQDVDVHQTVGSMASDAADRSGQKHWKHGDRPRLAWTDSAKRGNHASLGIENHSVAATSMGDETDGDEKSSPSSRDNALGQTSSERTHAGHQSPAAPRNAQKKPSDSVEFVDLGEIPATGQSTQQRQAWSSHETATSMGEKRRLQPHESHLKTDGKQSSAGETANSLHDMGEKQHLAHNPEQPAKPASRHAVRRQRQFKKKIAPGSPDAPTAASPTSVSDQDITTNGPTETPAGSDGSSLIASPDPNGHTQVFVLPVEGSMPTGNATASLSSGVLEDAPLPAMSSTPRLESSRQAQSAGHNSTGNHWLQVTVVSCP